MIRRNVRRCPWIGILIAATICLQVVTTAAHTVLTDLEYASVDGISLKLDLYLPDPRPADPVPLVLWVHGGAWRAGSKDTTYAPETLGEAYAVASIDYRLSQQAVFPAQIHDVKAAVRWLRAHADLYGLDPERFGAWGSSAGGHLVALLGTSCGHDDLEGAVGGHLEESSCVQAVCDFFGPTDFSVLLDQRGGRDPRRLMPEDELVGGPIEEYEALALLASPITHVTADDPPFLIMHGGDDPTVPVEQSIAFDQALRDAGVGSTLLIIDGAGHGFPREHLVHVKPWFDERLLRRSAVSVDDRATVAALHRSGQTFLTWTETSAPRYAIYRLDVSAEGLDDLVDVLPLGTVAAGSAVNAHGSEVEGRELRYVIKDGGSELPPGTGLWVHTTVETGSAAYAVAGLSEDGRPAEWIGGVGPIDEVVSVPSPVLQSSDVLRTVTRHRYTHWAPHVDAAHAEALCNRANQAFDFVVWEPAAPVEGAAAVFALHGGGGTYANAVPFPNHPDVWVISPESIIPGRPEVLDRPWDAWYGYGDRVGIEGSVDEGLIVDYTTRRLAWMERWLVASFPSIDADRLFLRGSSMGGVGTVFSAIMLRDTFAAGMAVVPRFDYGADDVFLESYETFATRWGAPEANLPTSDGIGVFDRLDAGFLARAHPAWDFAPVWAFNGRNDTAVGWSEKIPFYEAMQATRHGWAFYWDERAHGGQSPFPRQWREIGWEDAVLDWMIEHMRLDRSYPAFSSCSIDDDPGGGDPPDGDPIGAINGYLLWNPASIRDDIDGWSIHLSLHPDAPSTTCTVDVTPRRLQVLDVMPGEALAFRVRNATDGGVLKVGTCVVDPDGLITVRAVPVSIEGVRLTITRAAPPS